MHLITEPLRSLEAWTAHFRSADIPVLRHTCRQLDALRDQAEELHARQIARIVYDDPLMALKVLSRVSAQKRKGREGEIETVEQAVLMLGVPPFFRAFRGMRTVEDQLAADLRLQLGLMRVVVRAQRAGGYALDWAARRNDLDWEPILVASLLHDFAEMLLWCFAPALAFKISELQRANPTIRSTAAQRAVLGIELNDLEYCLMKAWGLPPFLMSMTDERRRSEQPRARIVTCAVSLARHTAHGWDDPALPDDYRAIGDLLRMPEDKVRELVLPKETADTAAKSPA